MPFHANHSFDPQLAKQYGLNEAILIHHFQFWIEYNAKRGKNFHEGKTWSFATMEQIAAHFPYMSTRQVRYALENLVKMEVLVKNNFNKSSYDRTLWYAFKDEKMFSICQNCQMERTSLSNRKDQIVTPIPDTKTDHISLDKSKEKEEDKCRNTSYQPGDEAKKPPNTHKRREQSSLSQPSHALRLATLLSSFFQKNIGKERKVNLTQWSRDIERMHSLDGYSYEEIEALINFSQKDAFWMANVQSGKKLREKADQLSMQMKNRSGRSRDRLSDPSKNILRRSSLLD